jgi:hypothetical protein
MNILANLLKGKDAKLKGLRDSSRNLMTASCNYKTIIYYGLKRNGTQMLLRFIYFILTKFIIDFVTD